MIRHNAKPKDGRLPHAKAAMHWATSSFALAAAVFLTGCRGFCFSRDSEHDIVE
jgi:hypothetical protein